MIKREYTDRVLELSKDNVIMLATYISSVILPKYENTW